MRKSEDAQHERGDGQAAGWGRFGRVGVGYAGSICTGETPLPLIEPAICQSGCEFGELAEAFPFTAVGLGAGLGVDAALRKPKGNLVGGHRPYSFWSVPMILYIGNRP